jgi:hypothetical protein
MDGVLQTISSAVVRSKRPVTFWAVTAVGGIDTYFLNMTHARSAALPAEQIGHCHALRTSRSDYDVALGADPLFGAEAELHHPESSSHQSSWVPDPLVPLVAAQRRRHSCCMPLSRTQPMPDLFGAVVDHEPDHGPARLTSIRPTPMVMSTADKSSPRYVLPRDLSDALRQLGDLELDRLVAASRHELQRRGRSMTPAPEIQPTTHISPGEPTSKPSIAKDPPSERQQLPESKGTLTQGQVNAVLATFKAGIAPSRIARQFGISQSDVRKVLASEPRRSGKGR